MELKTEGRRTYILGNTYRIRDRIYAAGMRWDAGRAGTPLPRNERITTVQ